MMKSMRPRSFDKVHHSSQAGYEDRRSEIQTIKFMRPRSFKVHPSPRRSASPNIAWHINNNNNK